MDNPQATVAELAWLAGILDGEGWVGFSIENRKQGPDKKMRSNPQFLWAKVEIKVGNTDPLIIDKVANVFAKLGINPYIRSTPPPKTSPKKDYFEVATKHMKTVEVILLAVLPYLASVKRRRAELMLAFIECRRNAPLVPNPSYTSGAKNVRGPRTMRPYTEREMAIIEECRALQSTGASEATRESRAAVVTRLRRWNLLRQQEKILPDDC